MLTAIVMDRELYPAKNSVPGRSERRDKADRQNLRMHGLVKIGIRKDNRRRLPTELERHVLQIRARRCGENPLPSCD